MSSDIVADLLMRITLYKRSVFFKMWNLSREEHDPMERLRFSLRSTLEQGELPKAPRFPKSLRFISMADSDYPSDLFQLPQPPLGLFVEGELCSLPRAAVVGSRKPTPYALRVTRELSRRWTKLGWTIVSGGALGIDSIAHQACVEQKRPTWVILGGGHFRLHPKSNESLFRSVIENGGALISEYAPYTDPRPFYFPERNRLIAALSDVMFLAQAHDKSGSLGTARTALDLGRDIYVLKPLIGDENFAGSQKLIELGAKPILAPEDIEMSAFRSESQV